MSKIIETLKLRTREFSDREAAPRPKEVVIEKTGHELTQKQLADIYFSATGKPKTPEPPVIIRIIERPGFTSVIPWLITSLAFLITAFSLFSTKRIFLDIKVIDEKAFHERGYFERAAPGFLPETARPAETASEVIKRSIALQDFIFEGAAYLKSSREKDMLTLVNSSVAPFARAVKNFDPPLDLRKSKIVFYAKGAMGGENLAVALKDEENMQAFYRGKIYPFPHHLTTDWQKAEIPLSNTAKGFNVHEVSGLRFEFGSKDTENKPGDTVYVRDLEWVAE